MSPVSMMNKHQEYAIIVSFLLDFLVRHQRDRENLYHELNSKRDLMLSVSRCNGGEIR